MPVHIVRLGTARLPGEGLRLGTVRRPPRGVRKSDYAAKNYFDVWLPELAPSPAWVKGALSQALTDQHWARYVKNYRREMRGPGKQHLLTLLARLSQATNFSVGCYCEDESHCHRSLLKKLLIEHGAQVT